MGAQIPVFPHDCNTDCDPNAGGGGMGGATACSVWYSIGLEPERGTSFGGLYDLSML